MGSVGISKVFLWNSVGIRRICFRAPLDWSGLSSALLPLPRSLLHSGAGDPCWAIPLPLRKSLDPSSKDGVGHVWHLGSILAPLGGIRARFWNVLAPLWKAEMPPKHYQNLKNSASRALLFWHCFLHWFFRFVSQLGPPKPYNSTSIYGFYNDVRLWNVFKIKSISDPIWESTKLDVGAQNQRMVWIFKLPRKL